MMSLFSMEGNYDYRSQLPYPECSNSTSQLNCEHCKCLEELVKIKEADHLAKGNFLIFSKTMGKYATPDNYTIWPEFKNQCLKSYKAWICSQFHQVYHLNHQCRKVRIKPCNSFCLNVEAACPIFRIFHSTKLRGGQPAFICNGFHIKDDEGSNDICYNSISQLRLTRNGQVPIDILNATPTSNPSGKNPPSQMHITRQRHTSHKTTTTSMVENNTTHLNNLASSLHYSFYTMFLASWSILFFFIKLFNF
uniref:FZ domain-containing protein n=1 Tax=Ciona savignyi TaxID=51511 RepID=H2ZM72_CIOSA